MAKGTNQISQFLGSGKVAGSNIAKVQSPGSKDEELVFNVSQVGSLQGGSSSVKTSKRQNIDVQGEIVSTGIASDLAIEGSGTFVVQSATSGNEFLYTRRGDFRQDVLGFWKNGSGMFLYGWRVDEDGKIPVNSSQTSSLEAVNFANAKGNPKASTAISLALNLDASQEAIRGPGPQFRINRSGLNSNTGRVDLNDLFVPEVRSNSSLAVGDQFTFTSNPPGRPKTIEYGGILVTRGPSSNDNMFGASSANTQFTFGNGAGQLLADATLTITVNNEPKVFIARPGSQNAAQREFSSLSSLINAINTDPALVAKIDTATGIAHIAAKDPDAEVKFTGQGGGADLIRELGLVDINASTSGVKRFNSLETLRNAVNADRDNFDLKAVVDGIQGTFDVTARKATSTLDIQTSSVGTHPIKRAVLGNNTEKGSATVRITAPNSGLSTGDLVRISGMNYGGTQLADGIYAVGAVDINGFAIHLVSNSPGAGGVGTNQANAIPVVAASTYVPVTNNASWQKIAGGSAAPLQSGNFVIQGGPALDGLISITTTETFAVGDVVYISSEGKMNVGGGGGTNVDLPDGYYVVQAAVAGASFDIKTRQTVAAGGNAYVGAANVSYQKVGVTEAGGNAFNAANGITTFTSKVFSTQIAAQDFVRLELPNNNYGVGDYISFKNLAAGYAFDGIAIENDTKYEIIARTGQYVEFRVVGAAAAAGIPAGTQYSTAAGNVDPNFIVNNYSRTLEYFGITNQLEETYEETYVAADDNKSLSGRYLNGSATTETQFSQTISAVDSLGEKFDLNLHFAKLQEGVWAVEVSLAQVDGQFNATNLANPNTGMILAGQITFGPNGELNNIQGVDEKIRINRDNGSATTDITLDWRNLLNEIKTGSVTQFKSANNIELVQDDGQTAGTLTNLSVDEDGNMIGTFDSGETRTLYRIPIATFANINGLAPVENGSFRVTRQSGGVLLKTANSPATGEIAGENVEASTTDRTQQLLVLKNASLDLSAVTQTVAQQFQMEKSTQDIISRGG